jgi:hypothetical protein
MHKTELQLTELIELGLISLGAPFKAVEGLDDVPDFPLGWHWHQHWPKIAQVNILLSRLRRTGLKPVLSPPDAELNELC